MTTLLPNTKDKLQEEIAEQKLKTHHQYLNSIKTIEELSYIGGQVLQRLQLLGAPITTEMMDNLADTIDTWANKQ